MSIMVCLDTDVMIDYISQKPYAVAFVQGAIAGGSRLTTTVMSVCELYKGSDQSSQPGRQKVERLLGYLEIYDLDVRACLLYREHYSKLSQKGTPIGDFDLLIACIALAHGETLASGNRRHFSRVAGLQLAKL